MLTCLLTLVQGDIFPLYNVMVYRQTKVVFIGCVFKTYSGICHGSYAERGNHVSIFLIST